MDSAEPFIYTTQFDSLSPPVNVTISAVKANSAVVTWDIPEGDPVIGFAITQQKKDVRMLRFIQEVNTTTRSCALWDLEEETDYIVHVQSISMSGSSPLSEPLRFRTPKEAETQASKSKDEVTMEEVGQSTQMRAGELIIIVVVLIMWAGPSACQDEAGTQGPLLSSGGAEAKLLQSGGSDTAWPV
ncbi:Fibronectin type III domain containing protein 5 [Dissostichus eleginoides]|uniref:Fibronectin type III domain containing protein 5 n=1 Tax=Dissostichus eleginoides TaxID=100907 RepID=A0AAD9C2P8_DISEL|nr:Fibronectin type III domain containing protein 5 [Dissostichus eleginoides]